MTDQAHVLQKGQKAYINVAIRIVQLGWEIMGQHTTDELTNRELKQSC